VVVSFIGVYRHFKQYFSYIVAVSFIGGGNVPGENHRPVAVLKKTYQQSTKKS
jgi:hypothetical protein